MGHGHRWCKLYVTHAQEQWTISEAPLAARMRPRTLAEFAGQGANVVCRYPSDRASRIRRRPCSSQSLHQAQEYPILGSWIMNGWQDQGITPVVVARQQAEDKVIYGVFLVNIYCGWLSRFGFCLPQFTPRMTQLAAVLFMYSTAGLSLCTAR